jgi:hypothetical protein
MCDDCDSEEPLDLVEFARDMACPPVDTNDAGRGASQAVSAGWQWSVILDPLGVV